MTRQWARLALAIALLSSLAVMPACQRTVEVQTGTRIVDSQGRVISEDIKTVRVPPETASAYRIVTITQPDSGAQVAALYAEAQKAIAAGDMLLAEKKLAEVVALSPGYGKAQSQLDAIAKGQKVTPDTTPRPTTPTTSTAPPASTTPTATAGALSRWIPDKLTGFTARKAAIDPLAVSREYAPGSGSAATNLVIYAEQFRSSAEAKQALEIQVKQRYPNSASIQTVHSHGTYFGTTTGFAVIGFTSGAVMVAVEAQPESGSAASLKSLLVSVVNQLP